MFELYLLLGCAYFLGLVTGLSAFFAMAFAIRLAERWWLQPRWLHPITDGPRDYGPHPSQEGGSS